ncbi:hypothetical protein PF327_01665 [Sulfurovum sp. XTW-4]|uniref:Uncharacterized protein n=1 Tax=Sulfurovum xiamenensis TaxID=3019066 RepID=A0ABT7QP91_9BACT|nr:hypothetical protein [Sulfurovum xiamenensis]MDM5262896.1 hypothetical protein [Sulfurovum xiamenensis]
MVNQASQSGYTTLQQEAIAAAASDISLIMTREWDESNTNDTLDSTILTTASGNYNQAARTNLRSRTYFSSTGGTRSASTLGADTGDLDDIDDVNGINTTLTPMGGSDLIDQTITIATTVSYLNDTSTSPVGTSASGATSNIKGITITLTSGGTTPELQKQIKLNAFSSNVGSYKLERKVFE